MSTPTLTASGHVRLYEPVSPRCYRIIRFYHPSLNRKRKDGVCFDGYDLMKGVKP